MSVCDLATDLNAVLDAARREIFGADAELKLYTVVGATWSQLGEALTGGWHARHLEAGWVLDLWAKTWDDIRQVGAARIVSHGQTLTFKLKIVDRRMVAGGRVRIDMNQIGDQP